MEKRGAGGQLVRLGSGGREARVELAARVQHVLAVPLKKVAHRGLITEEGRVEASRRVERDSNVGKEVGEDEGRLREVREGFGGCG